MGTFLGHALPGTFFIIFGFRWSVAVLNAYFRSLTTDRHKKYQTAASYSCSLCPRVPSEGIIKLVGCIIGIIGETFTAFKDGNFVHFGNSQHIAMYFFYGLNGLVDIVVFLGWPIPKFMDVGTMVLAGLVEMMLFYFHIHGRDPLDTRLHILLILSVAGACLLILCDAYVQHNATLSLARSVAVTLHGTWFWQIGFILYNPLPSARSWNPHDHQEMIVVTDIFVIHIAVNIILTAVIAAVMWLRYKKDWNRGRNTLLEDDNSATELECKTFGQISYADKNF